MTPIAAANAIITVNLEEPDHHRPRRRIDNEFDMDPHRKHCLLNGLDDIGLSLEKADAISTHEAKRDAATPWLNAANG